jgi:hypothetical protein
MTCLVMAVHGCGWALQRVLRRSGINLDPLSARPLAASRTVPHARPRVLRACAVRRRVMCECPRYADDQSLPRASRRQRLTRPFICCGRSMITHLPELPPNALNNDGAAFHPKAPGDSMQLLAGTDASLPLMATMALNFCRLSFIIRFCMPGVGCSRASIPRSKNRPPSGGRRLS